LTIAAAAAAALSSFLSVTKQSSGFCVLRGLWLFLCVPCSAGVIALDLARELLQLHPEKVALVVSHEVGVQEVVHVLAAQAPAAPCCDSLLWQCTHRGLQTLG
jgi:hypothetical protein